MLLPALMLAWVALAPAAMAGSTSPHAGFGAHFQHRATASAQGATVVTPLGVNTFDDMAVDDAHQHVFVSSRDNGAVVVMNFDGTVDTTITGLTEPAGLTIDANSHTLYVAEASATAVQMIDTASLTLGSTFALGTGACPRDLALAGGRLWFSYYCDDAPTVSGLGSLNLSSSEVTTAPDALGGCCVGLLTVDPSTPNVLYTAIEACPVMVTKFDVTGATPTQLARYAGSACSPYSAMDDITAVPGRAQLITTGQEPGYGVSWRASDLMPGAMHYPTPEETPGAAAASSDGAWVAVAEGGDPTQGIDVNVMAQGSATPWAGFAAGDGDAVSIRNGGLAFSGDASKLFAVAFDYTTTQQVFSVMDRPTAPGSFFHSLSLGPTGLGTGQTVTWRGTLVLSDGASAAGMTVHLWRMNPDYSITSLPDAVTDANSTFTYSEVATEAGFSSYYASWDGDADHTGTRAVRGVQVRQTPLPKGKLVLSLSTLHVGYQGKATVTAYLKAPTSPGARSITIYEVPVGSAGTSVSGTLNGARKFSHTFTLTRSTYFWATWGGDSTHQQTDTATKEITTGSQTHQALTGFYSVSSGYHLYHYSDQCKTSHTTDCPLDIVTVTPNDQGGQVCFSWQEYYAGAWHRDDSACTTLDVDSQAGLYLYYTSRAIIGVKTRIHAHFKGTAGNTESLSGWIYLKVTN